MLAQNRLTHVARLATMGEMAAGVAHELNQPLTAITTYARACERYLDMPVPDYAELREAVREIAPRDCAPAASSAGCGSWCATTSRTNALPTDINALIEELQVAPDRPMRACIRHAPAHRADTGPAASHAQIRRSCSS